MASATFKELMEAAEAEGIGTWEPPNGFSGDFRVKNTNTSKTKDGDPRIGLQLVVEGGPDNNKSFWINYNFIASSPKSLAFTFRDLAKMGVSGDVIGTWDESSSDYGQQVAAAFDGVRFSADVEVKLNGDYVNTNLRNIKKLSGPAQEAPVSTGETPLTGDQPF